jgi:hypothetical protein
MASWPSGRAATTKLDDSSVAFPIVRISGSWVLEAIVEPGQPTMPCPLEGPPRQWADRHPRLVIGTDYVSDPEERGSDWA